ncbi:MAG: hypothetical protein PIR02_06240 [Microbacterium enclense]
MTPGVAAVIRSHFEGSAYVGLVLPDGWFGRPYDNMSTLEGVILDGEELCISFDGDMRILLTGDVDTSLDGAALKISGFSKLLWSWRPCGSSDRREQTYTSGTLRMIHL